MGNTANYSKTTRTGMIAGGGVTTGLGVAQYGGAVACFFAGFACPPFWIGALVLAVTGTATTAAGGVVLGHGIDSARKWAARLEQEALQVGDEVAEYDRQHLLHEQLVRLVLEAHGARFDEQGHMFGFAEGSPIWTAHASMVQALEERLAQQVQLTQNQVKVIHALRDRFSEMQAAVVPTCD